MHLNYGLKDAGWATVTLTLGDQVVEMTASYLHDSLRDLCSAAIALVNGAPEVHVVFMDEPGEHELIARRGASELELEVLWHRDWTSWGMGDGTRERRLLGNTSLAHFRGQVLSELRRLLVENGEAGYKDKWVEHDFPIDGMRQLEASAAAVS